MEQGPLCCLTHMACTSELHDKLPDQKYRAVFTVFVWGVKRLSLCVDSVYIKVSLFLSLNAFGIC